MIVKKKGYVEPKVTRRAAKQQLEGQEVSCRGCGGVYAIEGRDIKTRYTYAYYTSTVPDLYVTCPLCKRKLEVEATFEQRIAFVRWWHNLTF